MHDCCIFCGATSDLTDEHVIPAALGGDLVLPNGTCRTCNSKFSFQFESDFINKLAPIRHIVGIANRDGNIPSARIRFSVGSDEFTGSLTGEGELRPDDKVIDRGDDPSAREYWMFSRRGRQRLEKHVKEHGMRLEPLKGDPLTVPIMGSIDLDFLNEAKAKRAIAKIAVLFMASKAGVSSAALDGIKNYVAYNGEDQVVRLFYNKEFLDATKLNASQHAIILASDSKRKCVSAIVVLFGGLTYVVQLAEMAVVDFGFTYLWDGQRRAEIGFFVHDYLHEHAGVELVETGATAFNDLIPVADYWAKLLEAAGQARQSAILKESE